MNTSKTIVCEIQIQATIQICQTEQGTYIAYDTPQAAYPDGYFEADTIADAIWGLLQKGFPVKRIDKPYVEG